MAYLYINPGHGNLFPSKTQQSYATQTSSTYTRTGVAFGLCGTCYLPDPPVGTKEIWAKFDNYAGANTNDGYFTVSSATKTCQVRTGGATKTVWVNNANKGTFVASILGYVLVHLISDATNGLFEVYERGVLGFTFSGNVLGGEDITSLSFTALYASIQYSNIIVSDTEIDKTENVITLPVSATDATMTDNGDGSYSASSAGEYVKQTVDKASLKQTYNADKTIITGVALAGRPAYYDGEGLYHMEALADNTVLSEEELTANDGAYSIISATSVSCSIDELANQYGWRAKA
mgnify:CR=1 FL=1